MLIVFPIGLWIFSMACDLIRLAGGSSDAWATVAFYSMVGGLIGALCAAVPGFIDLLYYKGGAPPVKKIALTHMAINLTAVVLYAINIWLRASGAYGMGIPVLLSIIGMALIFVSGWLGGRWCMSMAWVSKGANDIVSVVAISHRRHKVQMSESKADVSGPDLAKGIAVPKVADAAMLLGHAYVGHAERFDHADVDGELDAKTRNCTGPGRLSQHLRIAIRDSS
jgi:uncharacterized membrane protein